MASQLIAFDKLADAISAIVRARRAVEDAIEEASESAGRCLAIDEAQRQLTQVTDLLMRYLPANMAAGGKVDAS